MDAHLIIAGDSQALGFGNTGPAPYTPTVRVQIWADTDGNGIGDAWNYMNPGVNTGTLANPTVWGPEVGLANKWLASGEVGYLWILKSPDTVRGGTTLEIEWAPPHGSMFASTTAAASAAMHNLDGTPYAFSHYDAALVVLGTNDATIPAYADAYYANLGVFDPAARAAWHVDRLVEARITDEPGLAEDNLTVRQAQWQADQDDAAMVSFKTIGFGLQADHVHYDAAGQLALGAAAYDGWFL